MSTRKIVKPKKTKKNGPTVIRKEAAKELVSTDELSLLSQKIDKLDRKIPDVSLSNVGRKIGQRFGVGDLGAKAGSTLASIFGMGDYEISSNSIMSGHLNSQQALNASFKSTKNSIRVKEREFLGNVVTSVGVSAFNISSYPITPQSNTTFPWLSTIAYMFDQWEPHGIVFEFISAASSYANAGTIGNVIMATDYNPSDYTYPDKVTMQNAEFSCAARVSENLLHGVECDPKERPLPVLYTNNTNVSQQFSSLGNFQIATQGIPYASAMVGELWVSYDISFYKKALTPSVGLQLNGYIAGISSGTGVAPFAANFSWNQVPYGLPSTKYNYLLNSGATSTITFPRALKPSESMIVHQLCIYPTFLAASAINTTTSNVSIQQFDTGIGWCFRSDGIGTLQIRLFNPTDTVVVPTLTLTRAYVSAAQVETNIWFWYAGGWAPAGPSLAAPAHDDRDDYEDVPSKAGIFSKMLGGSS